MKRIVKSILFCSLEKTKSILLLILFTIVLSLYLQSQDIYKNWTDSIKNADSVHLSSVIYNVPNSQSLTISNLEIAFRHIHDDNPSVRKAMAIFLGESGKFPSQVIPRLVNLMRDTDEQVREQATVALSKYDSASVPTLLSLLRKNNYAGDSAKGKGEQIMIPQSYLAMIGLIHIKTSVAEPLFKEYSRGRDDKQKIEYVLRNNKYITSADIIPYLSSRSDAVKILALSLLGSQKSDAESAIPSIANLLKQKNKDVVRTALSALCQIGPKAIPILSKELKNKENDVETRLVILSGLYKGGQAALPMLLEAIGEDNEPEIRSKAADEIPEAGAYSDSTVEILCQALSDTNPTVVKAIANTLSVITDDTIPGNKNKLIAFLIKALRSRSGEVQSVAAELLGNSRDAGAYSDEALQELLGGISQPPSYTIYKTQSRESPKKQFIRAIGLLNKKSPVTIPVFHDILQADSLKYLYQSIFEAAGNMGGFSNPLVPDIVERLPFADPYAKQMALTSLSEIYPDGVNSLTAMLRSDHYNDSFKIAVCQALSKSAYKTDKLIQLLQALSNDRKKEELQIAACTTLMAQGFGNKKIDDQLKKALELNRYTYEIKDMFDKTRYDMSSFLAELCDDSKIADREDLLEILSEKYPGAFTNKVLLKELNNDDQEVKGEAIKMISRLSKDTLAYLTQSGNLVNNLRTIISAEVSSSLYTEDNEKKGFQHNKNPFMSAAYGLVKILGPLASPLLPTFDSFLRHPDAGVRLLAVQMIGIIGVDTLNVSEEVMGLLTDRESNVRMAAARTLIQLHVDIGQFNSTYLSVVIDNYIHRDFQNSYSRIDEFFHPTEVVVIGYGNTITLSTFPWPPPRYSNIAKFGVDVPMTLLGNDTTHLYDVYLKLVNGLKRVDPNFEQGLFGVPGGFAVLTKMERIHEDGTPLPGKYRWVTGKIPPLSFIDYLNQLFFEQPGYFREVAFVFTDESNFGYSNKPLPDIHSGGTDFPADLVNKPLKNTNCYVLIYSFKRIDGGKLINYNQLSAAVQLSNSGIYQSLSH